MVYASLLSLVNRNLPKPGRTNKRHVVSVGNEQGDVGKDKQIQLKAESLAKQLYEQEEFRCPEVIQQLSEDLELAKETLKAYVSFFNFDSMSMSNALQMFLEMLWPEDELELQHLFIAHFSERYIKCKKLSPQLQIAAYYLSWAIILLNADLNGGNQGRKMTCKEFIANLNNVGCACRCLYPQKDLEIVYERIKMMPLNAFSVRTKCQPKSQNETSCNSTFGAFSNPINSGQKTGYLSCKKVMDKNGRKTRASQRAWKPCTAVLKGMVLHLQKVICEPDRENTIGLHHAVAYPLICRKRPHVLCLRTAESRVFYLQAESKVEQKSWVATINHIAACYSAPPLYPVSRNTQAYHPPLLPSFPTPLSLEQQLESHKDSVQKVLEHMKYYRTLTCKNDTIWDHMVQEAKRYKTYVGALQELFCTK